MMWWATKTRLWMETRQSRRAIQGALPAFGDPNIATASLEKGGKGRGEGRGG